MPKNAQTMVQFFISVNVKILICREIILNSIILGGLRIPTEVSISLIFGNV